MFRSCYIILLITLVFLLNFGSGKWDGLKVTFGVFSNLPKTERAARNKGYTMVSDCGASSHFAGKRYAKNGDTTVVLLYDTNGYIAGIQAGFSKTQPNGYPRCPLKDHPFVLYEETQYITAYFVDPATICSTGRTRAMFRQDGIGTDLFIQNGTTPSHLLRIPNNEAGISTTKWTQGKCFPSMGMHYWYNVHKDMNCDEFYPVFLLYTGGKLNAFGWAFNADLSSSRYEHPPYYAFGNFIDPVPDCLKEQGRVSPMSTMHIYLTKQPELNVCTE